MGDTLSAGVETGTPVSEEGGLRKHIGDLLRYVARYRRNALVFVLLLTVGTGCTTLLSLSLKFFIDYAIVPKDWTMLVAISGVLVVCFFVICAAQVWRDYLYAGLAANVLNDLRSDLLRHLQSLPLGFFARTPLGDLLARFSTDLSAVEYGLDYGVRDAVAALLNVAFTMAGLFFLDWRLALVGVAGMPLCLIGPRILGPRALKSGYQLRGEQARLAGAIQENLSAQPVIKAFSLTNKMRDALIGQGKRLADLAARFAFLSAQTERTPNFAMMAFGIMVLVVGGIMTFNGALSVGSLASFNALFVTMNLHIETVSYAVPALLQAAAGMRRIRELLDEKPSIVELPGSKPLPRLAGSIALDHMNFGYAAGQPVLHDISLDIPRGFKVAFVGPSGSGKSTILKVILRFYDPLAGQVLFDGHDLRAVQLDSIYHQFGIVFQESFLFNLSIRENIRLGRPGASDAEVDAAAKSAELDPSLFGASGFDTVVGERGERLSGGQRQRVAIARALIRDPSVLVLDEATSALDPAAAAAINETIARVAGGRTVMAVTHRLQDVGDFDRIFVLERGRLAESGTHAELLARRGVYAALWRRQAGVSVSAAGGTGRITLEALRQIPLFDTIDDASATTISAQLVTEHVPADSIVIRQGELGSKFCVVVRGKLAVTQVNDAGETRELATLVDGDHFGEMSLVSAVPTNATVKTMTPSILLTLQREQFDQLIRHNAKLRERIDEVMRQR